MMDSEHYIYPGELAVLLVFLLLPALLLALGIQFPFLRWRGVPWGRALAALLASALASIIITLALFFLAPSILPQSLGFQDIRLGGRHYPVLPLAFAVTTVVSVAITSWVGRRRS